MAKARRRRKGKKPKAKKGKKVPPKLSLDTPLLGEEEDEADDEDSSN
jgi:hypothetical protein